MSGMAGILVLLSDKGYEVIPFILVFGFFLFHAKIEKICKVKRGKNECN